MALLVDALWREASRPPFFIGLGPGWGLEGLPGRPFPSRTGSLIAGGPKTDHLRAAFRTSGPTKVSLVRFGAPMCGPERKSSALAASQNPNPDPYQDQRVFSGVLRHDP